MIHLLDTNILIVLIKRHPPQVAERIDALAEEDSLAMSFITWAELLQGAESSQRRQATLQQLEALARQVPVLYPAGPAICRHYAAQATALRRQGTPIGVVACCVTGYTTTTSRRASYGGQAGSVCSSRLLRQGKCHSGRHDGERRG